MWKKIKNIFAVIGACVASVGIALFLKSRADRRRSEGNNVGTGKCEEGITNAQTAIADGVGKCEERIDRAEEILRKAIERSQQGNKKVSDVDGN